VGTEGLQEEVGRSKEKLYGGHRRRDLKDGYYLG